MKKVALAVFLILVALSVMTTVVRNRDWKNSQSLWEATYAAAPNSYRANTNLGRIYFQSSNPSLRQKGVEMTRVALKLSPEDPVARANLGSMLYIMGRTRLEQEQLDEASQLTWQAIEHLERALEKRPNDGSVLSNLGNGYRQLGTISTRRNHKSVVRKHHLQAMRHYQQALKRDHRKIVKAAWYNLGVLQMDMRSYEEAATSFRNFLRYRSDHADGYGRLGLCELQLGDYARAISDLEKAVQLRPTVGMYNYLATAHLEAGQSQEAIAIYSKAIQVFPRTPFLYYNLGLTYSRSGQSHQAIQTLQKVIELGTDSELSRKARSWMERMKGST